MECKKTQSNQRVEEKEKAKMNSLNYYNENSKKFIEDTFNVSMESLLTEFAALLKIGATILDVGCGSGRDSKWFLEHGYDVWAHDGSEDMVVHCQKFLKHRVELATFEEYHTDKKFDGLWACASLLHVPREKLPEILMKYVSFLNDGGIFFMSFKLRNKDFEKEGRLFTNFNEEGIKALVNEIPNLNIIKIFITSDVRAERVDEGWISVITKKTSIKV